MSIILNIGRNSSIGELSIGYLLRALDYVDIEKATIYEKQSDTEKTWIVAIPDDAKPDYNVDYDAVYCLAELLNQDCIAVYREDSWLGYLVGPRAAKWGEFDLAHFLFPDE